MLFQVTLIRRSCPSPPRKHPVHSPFSGLILLGKKYYRRKDVSQRTSAWTTLLCLQKHAVAHHNNVSLLTVPLAATALSITSCETLSLHGTCIPRSPSAATYASARRGANRHDRCTLHIALSHASERIKTKPLVTDRRPMYRPYSAEC